MADTTTEQNLEAPRPETPPRDSFITPEMIARNPVLAAAGTFAGDPLWKEAREDIKRNRERVRLEEEEGGQGSAGENRMSMEALQNRLAVVEAELAQLKQQAEAGIPQTMEPRWKQIIGVFKDDPLFDEAERLGREWREAQGMQYDKDDTH